MAKHKPPYPGFPLTFHPNGQFSKKIRGHVHYFGSIANGWQAALERFTDERDALYAGGAPPRDAVHLRDVLNAFHAVKEEQRDRGDLAERTFNEYKAVMDVIVGTLGKTRPIDSIGPEDLARLRGVLIAAKSGGTVAPTSQKRVLAYAKAVFRYGNDELGCRFKFRKALAAPPAKQLRRAKREAGERMFQPDEVRAVLAEAKGQLKAMIYLGINCGYDNRSVATLPVEAVTPGWAHHARPKTEVDRRCPLWPETEAAIAEVIGDRTTGLVFVTRYGNPWFDESTRRCPISVEFRKVARSVNVVGSFSWLRKTFRTAAQRSRMPEVVQYLMGHANQSMTDHYRQTLYEDLLREVTDCVRDWLNTGRPAAS